MSRPLPGRIVAAGCFLAVAIATVLAVLAHASRGPDVTLEVPRQVRADGALRLAVHGDLHGDGAVSVAIGRAGRPCTAGGATVAVPSLPATGAFRATGEAAVAGPGRYEVCAWARIRERDPRVVARSVVLARPPAGRVRLDGPAIAGMFPASRFVARGATEVPQPLTVVALRDRAGCTVSGVRFAEDDVELRTAVEGRFTVEFHRWWAREGRWTLCAVLGDPSGPTAVWPHLVLNPA